MSLTLITFTPGTKIKSSEVNANFAALNAELFDLDQDNFDPAAQLPDSLLAEIVNANKVNGSAIRAATIAQHGQFIWPVGGTLTTGQKGFPYRAAKALTAINVYLEVLTAPSGSAIIVDIKKNGVTIFTVKPQINAGSTTGGSGATFSVAAIAADDQLTAFVDQIGNVTPGMNLVISLRCKQMLPS